jgi:aldehyde dehydrogenase (NAD+)
MASTTTQRNTEVSHHKMFIGGEWVDSDERYELRNPANTDDFIATVAKGRAEHADAAVTAGKAAFAEGVWRKKSPAERAAVMNAVAERIMARGDELAILQARENGSPIRMSGAFHVALPAAHLQYFAALGESYEWDSVGPEIAPTPAKGHVRRSPIGVCVAILPWNTPLLLAIWKVGPALAAGNSVVIKPDEKTPLLTLALAEEFEAAGLPPGILNVVTGDGEEVGARLVSHPDVRKVAFTGSTAVGREIMRSAADTVKRVTLELGGKSPNIVLDDADLDLAVDGSLYAFLTLAGQACESGTRLLLPNSIHDEFVARMVERAENLTVGDPQDEATDMGPLVSEEQRDRVLGYIEEGKRAGATLATGGAPPEGSAYEKGWFVSPTIFTDVTNDMRIAREEIFGPVLCVLRYDDIDEAIAVANDTEYGLSGGVFGADEERALEVADQIDAGMVWINDWHVITCEYPFGGSKQSGVGRELGPRSLDEYTEQKFISVDGTGTRENKPYAISLG